MKSSEVLLCGSHITRRWGGLVAVNDVSIELTRGTVHAVIGTNGAGKSTLINMLSGEIPASSGSVHLMGQDVTQWTQARRARAGLVAATKETRSTQRSRSSRTADWLRKPNHKSPGFGGNQPMHVQ